MSLSKDLISLNWTDSDSENVAKAQDDCNGVAESSLGEAWYIQSVSQTKSQNSNYGICGNVNER